MGMLQSRSHGISIHRWFLVRTAEAGFEGPALYAGPVSMVGQLLRSLLAVLNDTRRKATSLFLSSHLRE